MEPLYTTREIRPGFWSAERAGIKRFGRTEVAAIAQCKRAARTANPEPKIQAAPPTPHIPRKARAKPAPRERLTPTVSPPIPPVVQTLNVLRHDQSITTATSVSARYQALVRPVCQHREHRDTCACTGFQVQRPTGDWTPSMSRQATFAFCKLMRWEWRLVPRIDPVERFR